MTCVFCPRFLLFVLEIYPLNESLPVCPKSAGPSEDKIYKTPRMYKRMSKTFQNISRWNKKMKNCTTSWQARWFLSRAKSRKKGVTAEDDEFCRYRGRKNRWSHSERRYNDTRTTFGSSSRWRRKSFPAVTWKKKLTANKRKKVSTPLVRSATVYESCRMDVVGRLPNNQ